MPTAGKKTYQVNRMGVARTFQNIRLFKDLSVIDNIKVGLHESMKYNLGSSLIRLPNYWKEEKRCTERAFELLDIFHMADLGFTELSMEPVVSKPGDPSALTRGRSAHPEGTVRDPCQGNEQAQPRGPRLYLLPLHD